MKTLDHHPPLPTQRAGRKAAGYRWIMISGAGATTILALLTTGQPLPPVPTLTLSLLAMATSVSSWLALRRRLPTTNMARLFAIAAAWSLPLLLTRPLFSGDIWSYLAQGLIAATGQDPYRIGPAQALGMDSPVVQHVSHYWLDTPAPYGPAWLALSRVIAMIAGENLIAGVALYRLLALGGVALIAWALPRLARRTGVAATTAVWLGLLNPLVLWHLLSGVHNDALMLGLMLTGMEIGLAGLQRRGPAGLTLLLAGTVVLTVAANIKIVAAAAVLCLGVAAARRRNHGWTGFMAVTAVSVGGTTVLSIIGGFGWISALHSGTAAVYSWMSPTTGTGLLISSAIDHRAPQVTAVCVAVTNLAGALIAAPLVVRFLLAVFRGERHPLHALGQIFAVVLLFGSIVQPWYVLWAILPLAVTVSAGRHTAIAVVSAVVAMAVPPDSAAADEIVAGYAAAAVLIGAALLVWLSRPVRAAPRPIACSHPLTRAVPEMVTIETIMRRISCYLPSATVQSDIRRGANPATWFGSHGHG